MREQYMRGGEGFIICYSIADRHSFVEAEEYRYGFVIQDSGPHGELSPFQESHPPCSRRRRRSRGPRGQQGRSGALWTEEGHGRGGTGNGKEVRMSLHRDVGGTKVRTHLAVRYTVNVWTWLVVSNMLVICIILSGNTWTRSSSLLSEKSGDISNRYVNGFYITYI